MKLRKYSLCLLSAALLFGSCKKELNQNDPQSFSDENAFTTIDHVQYGVNAAFGRYSTYATDVYKNALTSDEAKIGADNAGSGALTYRYQYGSDNTTGNDVIAGYYGYYSLIDQVNRVLPNVDKVTGGTEGRKSELKGQLLGLRGIAHFGLLQAFCKNYNPSDPLGVAIMTEFNAAAKPSRNTMGEVMAQIQADLDSAKNLLPLVTSTNFSDTVLNRLNVAAYQARIALYRGDFDAAVSYSSEVINSGIKPLVSGGEYAGIWIDNNTNESLFRIRFLQSVGIGGLWTGSGNSITIAPSDKLFNSYTAGDVRLASFIGTNAAGNHYVNKHYASSRGARIVDLKACRTAEMYLIRAEAYARKSSPDLAAGAADLNFLRSKRITGYVDETFTNTTQLFNAVLFERFKELCFEGFRFYDLKRNNLPVERSSTDASSQWQTLPANSHLFVYPIPRDAILANPNTIQNSGY